MGCRLKKRVEKAKEPGWTALSGKGDPIPEEDLQVKKGEIPKIGCNGVPKKGSILREYETE